MPTKAILHKSFKMRNYAKKQVILDNLYQDNEVMQGMLTVKSSKIKETGRVEDEAKLIKDYI